MSEGGLQLYPFLPALPPTMPVNKMLMSLGVGAETST